MSLRSPAERIIQTLAFEAVGLCLSVPLYMAIRTGEAGESAAVMLVLTAAVLLWSPMHNTIFDVADLWVTGRLASDRPKMLRLVHAISHEVTAVAVTMPILIWLGGHSLPDAIGMNLILTLFYTAYAYVFHLAYDRLRPVSYKDDANACDLRRSRC